MGKAGISAEDGVLIDLQTGKTDVLPAGSVNFGPLPVGGKVEVIKIASDDMNINIENPVIRNEIFSSLGRTVSGYAGVGVSVTTINNKAYEKINLIGAGVGTPGIGISGVSDSKSEEHYTDKGIDIIKNGGGVD